MSSWKKCILVICFFPFLIVSTYPWFSAQAANLFDFDICHGSIDIVHLIVHNVQHYNTNRWEKELLFTMSIGDVLSPHSLDFITDLILHPTSMHMWWMPPALFFSRKPAMGLFSPRGWSSSSFVLERFTNTVVTPCSGRACTRAVKERGFFILVQLSLLSLMICKSTNLLRADVCPKHVSVHSSCCLYQG